MASTTDGYYECSDAKEATPVVDALFCFEHGGSSIDVWYDCQSCEKEAFEWADKHGYTQCVSPYIQRSGTDNGAWVTANAGRWRVLSLKMCDGCHGRGGIQLDVSNQSAAQDADEPDTKQDASCHDAPAEEPVRELGF